MLLDLARIWRHGHALRAALLGVVDHAIADAQRRRQHERGRGRHDAVRQRPGDRHHLEGRTGLVGVDHGLVALVGGLVAEVVGVDQRDVRHGVDLAGPGVLDDRRAALGVELPHRRGQHLVRHHLDAVVDRETHVAARTRLCRLDDTQGLAGRVFDDHLTPGRAGELLVVPVLHAGQAVAVGAGVAHDLGAGRLQGVGALLLAIAAHAGQAERGRPVGEQGVGLASDVGETALRIVDGPIDAAPLET